MVKRSRLRTRGGKRRWLLVVLLTVLAGIGGGAWYAVHFSPDLIDQAKELFASRQWGGSENKDIIRGTIYDRNYKEIAVSYERVSVYANIREIENLDLVVKSLALILEESEQTLLDRLDSNTLRLWLAKDISQKQEEEIRKSDLAGIYLHKEYVRYYPQKDSAAHLIGFVENDTGLSGMEYYFDQLQAKHRVNQNDYESLPKIGEGKPGPDGKHLILTLDLKIQHVLDRFVGQHASDAPDVTLGILAMEASTGAIIGYSQAPSFDPNRFHTYSEHIFKDIFTDSIAVPDVFKVFLRDLSLLESQADNDLSLLPWSLLTEKRKLGVQLQLWDKLGAGGRQAYDFENYSSGDDSERSVQAVSLSDHRDFGTVPAILTPLQILTAITRSVNGGQRVNPHAAERYIIRKNQSEYLLERAPPPSGTPFFDADISEEIRFLLSSLGKSASLDSVVLDGRSISSIVVDNNILFTRHRLLLAVISADKPEIVLMAVLSRPGIEVQEHKDDSFVKEFNSLIPPVAALQQVMKNLSDMMRPKAKEEKNFSRSGGKGAENEEKNILQETVSVSMSRMPDLTGMSLRKSLRLLQNTLVKVEIEGTGRVVAQKPSPGTALSPGTQVLITLQRDEVDAEFKKVNEETE